MRTVHLIVIHCSATKENETPETEKIIGVEYYQAVIRDGVRDYSGFKEWRKQHPVTGVVEWMP